MTWTAASLLLLAAIVAFGLFGGRPYQKNMAPSPRAIWAGLACLAPYLALLALVAKQRRPGSITLGLAYGLGSIASAALVTLAVAGTIGRVVVILTMWTVPLLAGAIMGMIEVAQSLYEMSPWALPLLILFGLAQFRLVSAARQARASSPSIVRSQWMLGRIFGFASLAAIGFVAMSGRKSAEKREVQTFEADESRLLSEKLGVFHALMLVQSCASAYADSPSRRGYPPTLIAMGPGGSNCLDGALAAGTSPGFVLRYHATADSAGRNVGWWAIARRPDAKRADDAFMTDYTGVLYRRSLVYDRAPDRDEPDTAVAMYAINGDFLPRLVGVEECIRREYPTAGNAGGYPADLALLDRRRSGGCVAGDRKNRIVWTDGYLVSYVPDPPDRQGRIGGFALLAMPIHYGREAVRSFLVERDSVIHFTARNRAALPTDPVIVGCELHSSLRCRIAK